MLRAEPTRVGVAHDLSAQGSGLSARQTKGSPYAPGITPTPAVDLRVGIHFLEGVTQVVSLVNPAIFVKLLLSPMRKLEVSVLMAQGSNSPLPREPGRTSSFPAKHAKSLSTGALRLPATTVSDCDQALRQDLKLIVDGGWPQECGGEPWSAGLGDEGLRQARGACSSCGRRRRRWQTPAALRATTWRMSARFSVSICVFFIATAAHVADIHRPPIAAWWNTGMAFFGTGIALFSSFELFDDSSTTRTGKPSGATLRTRVSSSLPLISHGPTEPLPTPKGGWKVAEASGLFVANGALIMVYGTLNYFRVQRAIRRGVFPQNKLGVLVVFCSTGLPQFIPWLSDL